MTNRELIFGLVGLLIGAAPSIYMYVDSGADHAKSETRKVQIDNIVSKYEAQITFYNTQIDDLTKKIHQLDVTDEARHVTQQKLDDLIKKRDEVIRLYEIDINKVEFEGRNSTAPNDA
jgi:hypothetical protein